MLLSPGYMCRAERKKTLLGPGRAAVAAHGVGGLEPTLAIDCEWRPQRVSGEPHNPGMCVPGTSYVAVALRLL